MTEKKVLIITDIAKDCGRFFKPPFSLAPELVLVTGAASLQYLGFTGFATVIIDSPRLHKELGKISLGIRDSIETEALWQIFCGACAAEVYILIGQKAAATKTMRELGISYLAESELAELVAARVAADNTAGSGATISAQTMLTADEIRTLHQSGVRNLDAGRPMTPWAAEVAESLGMKVVSTQNHFLVNLAALSPKKLREISEEIFALSTRLPELLYVINPATIAAFAATFPSLRGRVVASTIHWASQGAYTGETSAAMLADLRCYGAIVPAQLPYCTAANLKELLQQAQKHNLKLFSTFTLAYGTGCDIIAPDGAASEQMTPLYNAEVSTETPANGGIIAGLEYYRKLPTRKG